MTTQARELAIVVALGLVPAGLQAGPHQEKVEGYAEWRRGGCWIVDAARVCPGPSMDFKGKGRAHDFDSIPVGYEVKAKGVRAPDGALIAHKVEARPNGSALFEGDLRQAFDELEDRYRHRGRVFDEDDDGDVNEDYGPLLESGPEVQRVRAITARLVPPYLEPEHFRVYVVDNEEWNAMAAPNGAIFVFTGLLRDLDDDELAFILGHELAHATHEHGRKQFKKGLWIQLAALAAMGLAEEGIEGDVPRIAAQGMALLGALAWSSSYGRSHEDQADRVGLRYAYEAGYDVSRGPTLWARFAKKYGDTPRLIHFFLDEHSRSTTRAAKLQREIAMNYSATRPDTVRYALTHRDQ